jgi:hypothetical protein
MRLKPCFADFTDKFLFSEHLFLRLIGYQTRNKTDSILMAHRADAILLEETNSDDDSGGKPAKWPRFST